LVRIHEIYLPKLIKILRKYPSSVFLPLFVFNRKDLAIDSRRFRISPHFLKVLQKKARKMENIGPITNAKMIFGFF